MKFTVAGNKIVCSRIDTTVANAERHRHVVEFDAHVDSVPPHVAAKLTTGEIRDLEHFLADRKRIQANPAEINMLEALPELIEEVTGTLIAVDRLNESMYRKLCTSVSRLAGALQEVRPERAGQLTPIQGMRESEALKERLENIKQDL